MVARLDPRTFPVERIADLVHALPPPGTAIEIAEVPGAEMAKAWLDAHGRPATLVPAGGPVPTRLWRPSPGLLGVELGNGRTAIDVGCGTGRDVVHLALLGWKVTGVDRLPDALDRARSLADLHGVNPDLRCLDAERDPLPSGPFDLVLAARFLLPLALLAALLAPGGSLVVETFTDRERTRTGKPRDAALVLPADGPPALPHGLVLLAYDVRTIDGRELALLRARRQG